MKDFLKFPRPQKIPTLDDYVRTPAALDCLKGGRKVHRTTIDHNSGLLTVITIVLNACQSLPKTLESIRLQSYKNIELIIVDGGSQDGTLELIKSHECEIDIWMSEPDRGISDAFNKGIALSTGEYLALVNADDWLDPNHFQAAVQHLNSSCADFTFGNLMFHDPSGTPLYTVIGDPQYTRHIRHGMPAINHPSIVSRRSLYDLNGLFDTTFRIAMDYEWLLRNYVRGARGAYLPGVTSHMGAGGISQRRILESLQEVRRASLQYGYPPFHANLRYAVRALKLNARLFIERRVSASLAKSLRGLINPRYRKHNLSQRT